MLWVLDCSGMNIFSVLPSDKHPPSRSLQRRVFFPFSKSSFSCSVLDRLRQGIIPAPHGWYDHACDCGFPWGGEEREIGENDCVVGFRKYINSERFRATYMPCPSGYMRCSGLFDWRMENAINSSSWTQTPSTRALTVSPPVLDCR